MAIENESAGRSRIAWRKWAIRFLAFALVAIIGDVVWSVVATGIAASHAERCLHATRLTIRAVEDYVKQHNGNWPRSWSDLSRTSRHVEDVYVWTQGPENVHNFVILNCNADPDLIALQSVEEFDAIKPNSNYYTSWESVRVEIPFLLKVIRETRRARQADFESRPAPAN